MSSTVSVGGFDVTSNLPGSELTASLTSAKEGAPEPTLTVDEGKPVTDDDRAKAKLTEAATELGKKGGEAAAEKRKAAAEEKDKPEAEESQEAKAEGEPEKDKKGNPRHDPKARIAQVVREKREAEERAARAERELAEARKSTASPEAKPTEKAASRDPDARPLPNEFEEWTDYEDALEDWRDARRAKKAAEVTTAEGRRLQFIAQAESLNEHLHAAAKADKAFTESVSQDVLDCEPTAVVRHRGETPDARSWIADHYMEFPEDAPDTMRALSANDGVEFQRIAALSSPRAVTRELARLVAKKSVDAVTADTSSKPEVSKAPPPVKSVTGAPSTVPLGGFREGMSFDEWLLKNPQRAAR